MELDISDLEEDDKQPPLRCCTQHLNTETSQSAAPVACKKVMGNVGRKQGDTRYISDSILVPKLQFVQYIFYVYL